MTFLDANPRKDVCANIPGNLQEMEKLKALIDELNVQIYNPVGAEHQVAALCCLPFRECSSSVRPS